MDYLGINVTKIGTMNFIRYSLVDKIPCLLHNYASIVMNPHLMKVKVVPFQTFVRVLSMFLLCIFTYIYTHKDIS